MHFTYFTISFIEYNIHQHFILGDILQKGQSFAQRTFKHKFFPQNEFLKIKI